MSESTIDLEITPDEDETKITKFLLACRGEGEYKVQVNSSEGKFIIQCLETGAKYTAYASELLSKKQQITIQALLSIGGRDHSRILAKKG